MGNVVVVVGEVTLLFSTIVGSRILSAPTVFCILLLIITFPDMLKYSKNIYIELNAKINI